MKKFFMTVLLAAMPLIFFADDTFYLVEAPYTITQKIASKLLQQENVYVRIRGKRALTWHNDIRTIIDEAKKFRSNTSRLSEMNNLCVMLSAEFAAEYEAIDSSLPEIAKKCIEPALGREDLLWAMVLTINLDNYLEKYVLKNISENEPIKEEAENIKNVMKDKCVERFDDDTLKKFVEDYKKLFPERKLLFEHTPPSNFKDCMILVYSALNAYDNLDKYSAVAEFADWGENMLNFLIMAHEPMLIKEYEMRYTAYRNNFKVK